MNAGLTPSSDATSAATHADAIRPAGLAAGTLAELLTAAVDLSGVALVVRAQ
jgi:hypothetical protein